METSLRGCTQALQLLAGMALTAGLLVAGVTGAAANHAAPAPGIVGTYAGTYTSTWREVHTYPAALLITRAKPVANGQTSIRGTVILGNSARRQRVGGMAKPSTQNPDETELNFGWKVKNVTTSFTGQLDPRTGQYSGTYVDQQYVYTFPEAGWIVNDRGNFSLQKQ